MCSKRQLKKSSETIMEELLGPLVDIEKKDETRLNDAIRNAKDLKEAAALIKNYETRKAPEII